MDSKNKGIEFLASFIIVLRRYILLIFSPYKVLRHIAAETDYNQVFIIFFLVLVYFQVASIFKEYYYSPLVTFGVVLFNFLATVSFFFVMSKIIHRQVAMRSFFFTFAYTLFPTLVWFIVNSLLFVLLPPPRTLSAPGKLFSIVFISFSVSVLVWKLILVFLAVRFSSRLNFFPIVYMMLLYVALTLPYWLVMYHLKLFRIPFI